MSYHLTTLNSYRLFQMFETNMYLGGRKDSARCNTIHTQNGESSANTSLPLSLFSLHFGAHLECVGWKMEKAKEAIMWSKKNKNNILERRLGVLL